jgi:hypothetical protein
MQKCMKNSQVHVFFEVDHNTFTRFRRGETTVFSFRQTCRMPRKILMTGFFMDPNTFSPVQKGRDSSPFPSTLSGYVLKN